MKNTVVVDVKSWGRRKSFNPQTGRKDILLFIQASVGSKAISRLEKLRVGANSILTELVLANDYMYGEERRRAIRNLLKKAGYSIRFRNVTRHTADQLNK